MTLENERLSHAGTAGSVLDYFPGWRGKVITGELSGSAVEHLERDSGWRWDGLLGIYPGDLLMEPKMTV